MSWNEYRKSLLDQMALLREQLQAEGPIEVVTQGLLGGSNR